MTQSSTMTVYVFWKIIVWSSSILMYFMQGPPRAWVNVCSSDMQYIYNRKCLNFRPRTKTHHAAQKIISKSVKITLFIFQVYFWPSSGFSLYLGNKPGLSSSSQLRNASRRAENIRVWINLNYTAVHVEYILPRLLEFIQVIHSGGAAIVKKNIQ